VGRSQLFFTNKQHSKKMKNIEEAKKKLTEAQEALVKIVGEKIVGYFAPIFAHLDYQSGEVPTQEAIDAEEAAKIDAEASEKAVAAIAAQKAEIEEDEKKVAAAKAVLEKIHNLNSESLEALLAKVDGALEPKAEKQKKAKDAEAATAAETK
jgi:hypothetical protein